MGFVIQNYSCGIAKAEVRYVTKNVKTEEHMGVITLLGNSRRWQVHHKQVDNCSELRPGS